MVVCQLGTVAGEYLDEKAMQLACSKMVNFGRQTLRQFGRLLLFAGSVLPLIFAFRFVGLRHDI